MQSTRVSNLGPLRGMPLSKLDLSKCIALTDLEPLKGMPLQTLNLTQTSVNDLTPLAGMPLETLEVVGTLVSDISALHGAPLKRLSIRDGKGKKLTDLSPILSLARLEWVGCNLLTKELLPLRHSASLQTIFADAYPGEGTKGPRPVAEFWAAYDAHQKATAK